MYILAYSSSCPLSRQIKTLLNFLGSEYQVIVKEYWNQDSYKAYNIFLPSLIGSQVGEIKNHWAILEYLSYQFNSFYLFPSGIKDTCEMRNLLYTINDVMNRSICVVLIYEKLIKLLKKGGPPDISRLKEARKELRSFLNYFDKLIEQKNFILYDKISIVDIALASQIAILDYFGEIAWCRYPKLTDWYRVIKSLPPFNMLLKEKIGTFMPPKHYASLDF